jgi:hypothetical protein
MRLYTISLLPLSAAAVVALLDRRPLYGLAITLLVTLVCTGLVVGLLPMETESALYGWDCVLDDMARSVLLWMYWGTAGLCLCAVVVGRTTSFNASALASIGLATVPLLVQEPWTSLMILPCFLAAVSMVGRPHSPTGLRGASELLVLSVLPIPCLVALWSILGREASHPGDPALAQVASLLAVAPVALWLGLFPFQSALRSWAANRVPLGPAFAWLVRDAVVLSLVVAVWQRYPALGTDGALRLMGAAGMLSAVVSGILAISQNHAGSVLGCAVAGQLGIAVAGLAARSQGAWLGALDLLVGRTAAVLLGVTALTAVDVANVSLGPDWSWAGVSWRRWLGIAGFVFAVLSLTGLIPGAGYWGWQQVWSELDPGFQTAHLIASASIMVGLARNLSSLLTAEPTDSGRERASVAFVLLAAALAFVSYVALHPSSSAQWAPVPFRSSPFL